MQMIGVLSLKTGGSRGKMYNTRLFYVFFMILSASLNAGWIERKAEGWAWYEDRPSPIEIEETIDAGPISSSQILEQAKKELGDKLADAILNPTGENITVYLALQKAWIGRSSKFSEEWAKALLNYPEFDSNISYPTSHYGRKIARNVENQKRVVQIKEIAQNSSLLFFYDGKDKISQAFSLVVKEFGKKYLWNIVAISCDGTLLDGFVTNQPDKGISQQFGLYKTPALFVVDPSTNEAFAIAYGLVSIDVIENNILIRFPENKEDFNE